MVNESINELFHTWFVSYYSDLCHYANRFVYDTASAEDIVQESYANLWNHRSEIKADGNIKSYLYRSVFTKSLNQLRHRKVETSYIDNFIIESSQKYDYLNPKHAAYIDSFEIEDALEKIMMALPEKTRQIFQMSRFLGLKNKEIAENLEISESNVERHLTIAVKIIKKQLKDNELYILSPFVATIIDKIIS